MPASLHRPASKGSLISCDASWQSVPIRIARGGAETLADNCRSHMMRPRSPREHTGRANEPALSRPPATPEAPSRIASLVAVVLVLVTGTLGADPWEHSSASLARHTRPSPQTTVQRTQSMNGPGPTSLCAARPTACIYDTSYNNVWYITACCPSAACRKGSHARTPSC